MFSANEQREHRRLLVQASLLDGLRMSPAKLHRLRHERRQSMGLHMLGSEYQHFVWEMRIGVQNLTQRL